MQTAPEKGPTRAAGRRWSLRSFLQDRSGVGAIEFAILAPVLIALYIISLELTLAIVTDTKVSRAGNITLDLITQDTETSKTDLAGMADVAASILSPFSANNVTLIYTGIEVDDDGDPEIDWSWSSATDGRVYQNGDDVDIPEGLKIAGAYYVRVEISNPYNFLTTLPLINTDVTSITMAETYYMRPRAGADLDCTDC
jgi:Flp pilus assembly protein TadG